MSKTCKYCYGKGYYSYYSGGVGGFTDFGPREYINVENAGIKNETCKKCGGSGKEPKKTFREKFYYLFRKYYG